MAGLESALILALARQLPDALTEVPLHYGRADVMTPTDVFEVETLRTWKTGAAQALGYAAMSGRRPNLAVFSRWDVSPYVAAELYLRVMGGPGGLQLWAWSHGLWVAITSEPTAAWRWVEPRTNAAVA